MEKQNCWEYKKCGREQGGENSGELGVCPAAVEGQGAGHNSGDYRGRMCWAVAGTFCDGKVTGSFAQKTKTCLTCDFYQKVVKEEGDDFEMLLTYM